ncbi:MAG: Aspartyl/glutamyl-tRNA(Asn/Gln) amidotransferase subunit B [Alphaproteobacteria bacterium MarineAlpha3_Bin5]|nr:Asp-tRNA(Asn)/Glu-tRNA(Gln) amidotransferase GatCAB subunit B [Magnetovibrio sp.]PPR77330.1 MAG: Aspartyl/glutamyl-tRNA(Asn/Gln) amidotransferase subunit B [Alphaproteobacteria bacterium MarineAlpha3_Bin5]
MAYTIQGKTQEWEVVVGLEVHAQVTSKAKLFSGASAAYGGAPNSQVSLVDAAMPGVLPVINSYCIEQAVRTGLGLRAKINEDSVFERKNYFYPDLPQGYQISQYQKPIVGEGVVMLDMEDGTRREIGIERLHMEQDAGKSMHDQAPSSSYIDLNRSGICLMEIVSKPDMRSSGEAGAFLRKLRSIMRYLGTCDGNMEEGSMRADVNVSVRPLGSSRYLTRTETKNVNSVRFVMQAIEFESNRQTVAYENGDSVIQETRLFDSQCSETRAMRAKEFAHDYRYFPDPDLLPLKLSSSFIQKIQDGLPELPDEKRDRFMEDYELKAYDAGILVADQEVANYFEDIAIDHDPKLSANWIITNLFSVLKKLGCNIVESPISASDLGELIGLVEDNTISGRTAKEVFDTMIDTGKSASDIVDEKGLKQISDISQIDTIIKQVLTDNPKQLAQVKAGNAKVIGWFVGQVMKATKGKANPEIVNKLLREKIK